MAKGDDTLQKKKNKALRKRNNRSSSALSVKVSAAIAAKKRRKAGKRRLCQGMCYSLPTPEDPFNDRHGKEDFKTKGPKKKTLPMKDEMVPLIEKGATRRKGSLDVKISKKSYHLEKENESDKATDNLSESENTEETETEDDLSGAQQNHREISEFPSKFVFWCLSSIENALREGDAYTDGEGNSLFANSWGLEFSKCYATGKDVMETSGNSATNEQIAWVISGAADTFVGKELQGVSFSSPFLIFLVPSQEKATQVRKVCKPLKSIGIHTVSIHPGASLDHQIDGLKSCEPEFLVSTPERLLELVSLKAIDISGVSMLVVDGLNAICSAGHSDTLKSIKKFISGNPRLLVFNDCFSHTYIAMVQNLLTGPICRLSLNNSITSLSSCIIQSVEVCTSEDKLVKGIQAQHPFWSSHTHNSRLLYILRKDVKCDKLVKNLKSKGCSISPDSESVDSNSRVSVVYLEHILTTDIGVYDVVILPSFVPSTDSYVHILTKMARQSVNGVLHSYLTKRDTELAGPLVEILEQCGQKVPPTLKSLQHQT
ncbi:hypothetical protein TanjilG_03559 [Lupinus angustifolius]|uniref:Uncharacterized protein n=1 Tax=Lupinus angustifolius TaxID=3871 RepID=A0A1J7H587_LUPAN|nr:PREDICTED: DEAD-box ATP-dependent RNA helicase 5 [Lupinus angustifolius]OIW07772.1 hypothetical protein TanjilG_03559 [Lupinus angustifolius]